MFSRIAIALALLTGPAAAQGISYATGGFIPNNAAFQTPQVRIADGQSLRTNYFALGYGGSTANALMSGCTACATPSSVGNTTWNVQTQTVLTIGLQNPSFPSDVVPIGSGGNLPNGYGGIVGYTASMQGSYPSPASTEDTGNAAQIGRISAMAQQLQRYANAKPLIPIVDYDVACGGSDWAVGSCGGLGPTTATFTYSETGTVLTISGITGTVTPSQVFQGPTPTNPVNQFVSPFGGSGCGGTCTGTGGNGTYAMTQSQTVSGSNGSGISHSWYSLLLLNAAVEAALPSTSRRLNAACFRSVGWDQNGDNEDTTDPSATEAQWTAMEAAFDAVNLPLCGSASGLLFYIAMRPPYSEDTALEGRDQGIVSFVRADANGRTIGTSPTYPYQMETVVGINTDVHTGPYGSARRGEFEGLAAYITEDEGVFFHPLWLSLTNAIVVCTSCNPQTVTMPFDRPPGVEFASGALSFAWTVTDGIQAWPQQGFDLKVGSATPGAGTECPVTAAISGMNVVMTVVSSPCFVSGQSIEPSYAWYGSGGPNPGNNSGVGGNLHMIGPASSLFPGLTIDSWAWPNDQIVQAP